MGDGATLTVRLPVETKERLAVLASLTRRAASGIAAEAIAGYVARELAAVAAIETGQQDTRAGRFAPHEAVIAEVRAIIAEADLEP